MKATLSSPTAYQAFQVLGGFFGARIKMIRALLPLTAGDRVVDVGCGPGFLAVRLPGDIAYVGYDTDERYIGYAQAHFGHRGRFVLGLFDESAAAALAPVDVIMMNGLLHHLNDDEARQTIAVAHSALRPGGFLFTLDGCFVPDQSAIARYLLKKDRGEFVRERDGYVSLVEPVFGRTDVHIDSHLSRVPYTFIVMLARK